MSDGRPAGRAHPGPHEHQDSAAALRIRCYRHEGVVLANHRFVRGLGRLAATWELLLADGRTLTAPAELPDLRLGETAAVPLPLRLPRDGGEAWLTLRVVTAADEPWAPRGTQLCAPRVRLRATAVSGSVPASVSYGPHTTAAPPVPPGIHRRSRTLRAV
ncbi:hypothetical protein ADK64_26535 [Streptomyces sp. MMG1121]|nr:hypothetical protein ADK64_26535 [Streptomyces sp. MMG1121]